MTETSECKICACGKKYISHDWRCFDCAMASMNNDRPKINQTNVFEVMSEAAEPEQISALLCKVFMECGVEIPSTPEGWAHHEVRLLGAIADNKKKAAVLDAYQDAHNNLMRC